MSPLLLDTHVWLWEIGGTGQLSRSIRSRINDAAEAGEVRLSSISLWEIGMLTSRGKIDLGRSVSAWVSEARKKSRVIVEPVTADIALEAGDLPGGFRSDPADQIIVATARVTGATLLTRDRRILAYAETGNVNALAA